MINRTVLGLLSVMGAIAITSCREQTPETYTTSPTPSPTATASPAESLSSSPSSSSSPSPSESSTALEITAQGIGPAKLGMTYGDLKKALPEATFEVKKPFIVDFDAIAVQQGGQTLFEILYPAGDSLSESTPIEILRSENPNTRTAAGVGPGTPLSQAESAYGKATLSYNLDNEGREYVSFANTPIERLNFRLGAYGDNSLQGIYDQAAGEGGNRETNRYKEGATIQAIELTCVPGKCPKSQN